jgi:exo-beta-1,3-glucanase (GH17 family)
LQDENVTVEDIEVELDQLREAGFTGIATFGCSGLLAEIPRLAKIRQIAVIMGVYDVTSKAEITRALRRSQYVDAYCVGYNGLGDRHTLKDLKKAIRFIQRRSGLPVSTTEYATKYEVNPGLAEVGDWLFPDVHLSLKKDMIGRVELNVDQDVRLYVDSTRTIARLANELDRPLMLNSVAYPHQSIPGASEDAQTEFYSKVLVAFRDPQEGLPVSVSICPHSAFDAPWKAKGQYDPWSPHIGLLRSDGTARPAVMEIRSQVSVYVDERENETD